jgi:hypothetical protein
VLNSSGKSSTFSSNFDSAAYDSWTGGVPFLSVKSTLNPSSGKLSSLDFRVVLNGIDAT